MEFEGSLFTCRDMEDAIMEYPDNYFDMIVTDPPYGVDFNSDIYDDAPNVVFTRFHVWLREMCRVLKPSRHIYLFVPTLHLDRWMKEVRRYFKINNVLATQCYHQGSFTANNNFTFDFQPVIYASKGKPRDFNKVDWIPHSDVWLKDKRNTHKEDKWTYLYPSYIPYDIIKSNIRGNNFEKREHPNQKNDQFIQYLIEMGTEPHEIVGDFFGGIGTTFLAAILAGRNAVSFEKNYEIYERACAFIRSHYHG